MAAVIGHYFEVAAILTVLLSDRPEDVEPARALLNAYLRLPDAWDRFGGVPARLPVSFEREVKAFPGVVVPPEGDVILGIASTGELVAFGEVARLEPGVCEFKRVYVRPDHRRRHAATQLAQAMIDLGRTLGYRRAVLDVMPDRIAALALWTGLGFRSCPPYRTYRFAMEFMDIDLAGTSLEP